MKIDVLKTSECFRSEREEWRLQNTFENKPQNIISCLYRVEKEKQAKKKKRQIFTCEIPKSLRIEIYHKNIFRRIHLCAFSVPWNGNILMLQVYLLFSPFNVCNVFVVHIGVHNTYTWWMLCIPLHNNFLIFSAAKRKSVCFAQWIQS